MWPHLSVLSPVIFYTSCREYISIVNSSVSFTKTRKTKPYVLHCQSKMYENRLQWIEAKRNRQQYLLCFPIFSICYFLVCFSLFSCTLSKSTKRQKELGKVVNDFGPWILSSPIPFLFFFCFYFSWLLFWIVHFKVGWYCQCLGFRSQ